MCCLNYAYPNVLDFKVRRTNFEFLTFFSSEVGNDVEKDFNFVAFYYIIDNSCCSKFKCWRETISPPHFDLQERATTPE